MQLRSLGQEDFLEEGMATHSSILAWRMPGTEKHGGLQSIRVTKSQTLTEVTQHACKIAYGKEWSGHGKYFMWIKYHFIGENLHVSLELLTPLILFISILLLADYYSYLLSTSYMKRKKKRIYVFFIHNYNPSVQNKHVVCSRSSVQSTVNNIHCCVYFTKGWRNSRKF